MSLENENNNKSIVSLGFVICGFLAYFLTGVLIDILAGAIGTVARFRSEQLVQHGLPVGIGVLVFSLLFFNSRIQLWADEAVSEVRKVVWPSRKDVVAMTTVCCVMVVVAGIGFGVFDFVASQLIKVFVK